MLELLQTLVVAAMAGYHLRMMLSAQQHEGSMLAYHTGGLDTLALLSTALLTSCIVLWWSFVFFCARFNIDLVFRVYEGIDVDVFPTALADEGHGLLHAVRSFERLEERIVMLSWYFALNGIVILIHIARLLHLMHFHPRLGVVTRSLVIAMPDLFNFLLVAGVVFAGACSCQLPLCARAVLRQLCRAAVGWNPLETPAASLSCLGAFLVGWNFLGLGNVFVCLQALHLGDRTGVHSKAVVVRYIVRTFHQLRALMSIAVTRCAGYAMMGHLIFGATLTKFSTFPDAVVTCLEAVMGDPGINNELKQLPGLLVCCWL